MNTLNWVRITGRSLVLAAGLAVAGVHSGCVAILAGAAGAGTVAYVRGELQATLAEDYDATVRAADQALADLKFVRVNEARDALKTKLIARTAEDEKVAIVVSKLGDQLSKVEIRVGIFGDQDISQAVFLKMKTHL